MTRTEKAFNAVELMRRIRDELGREFSGMSFEEQKRRMDEELRNARVARDGDGDRSDVALE